VDEVQSWIAIIGAVLAATLGIFKYFNYRSRRDRMAIVGQTFSSTIEGLASNTEAKQLAAAILLRRFFDATTEQGAVGAPYGREAIAVIAALLRETETGELQKLLADGLGYAPTLRRADLQRCNLANAYLGRREHVKHGPRALQLVRRGGGSSRRNSNSATQVRGSLGDAMKDSEPVDLSEADLFGADLSGASLRGATALRTVFYRAVLRSTVLEEADLRNADFRDSELEGARFKAARLAGARFEGANNVPAQIEALLDEQRTVPLDAAALAS
jgi:Pentapeptide repeats (8 copies)